MVFLSFLSTYCHDLGGSCLAFVVLEHMAFCFDSSPCAPLSLQSCSAHLVILFTNSPFPPALVVPVECPAGRLFVPEALRPEVLQWGHESRVTCFPGVRRLLAAIRQRHWPGCQAVCVACSVCAQNKVSNHPSVGLLQPLPIPSLPWSHIALYFVSGLPDTWWIASTRRFILYPFPSSLLLRRQPNWLLTTSSGSMVFRLTWSLIGVPSLSLIFGRNYVDRSGPLRVCHQVFIPRPTDSVSEPIRISSGLSRCLAFRDPASWSQQLTWIEYSHNTLPVASTGMSPFECSIGYLPPLFPSQEPDAAVPSALAFVRRCRSVWRKARKALVQASRRTKAAADRHRIPAPRYVCGQKVWLSTKDMPLKACHVLRPPCCSIC